MARWTASAKWAEGPALDGQRDMPLALSLSEGLGSAPDAEFVRHGGEPPKAPPLLGSMTDSLPKREIGRMRGARRLTCMRWTVPVHSGEAALWLFGLRPSWPPDFA